jgi:hypothetical protein
MPWPLLLTVWFAASPALWSAGGVVAAAVVAAGGTYLLNRRSTSGSVTTSNAADLWAESKSIREWAVAQVVRLEEDLTTERAERAADRVRFAADIEVERGERLRLEGALSVALNENNELRERIAVLEARTSE